MKSAISFPQDLFNRALATRDRSYSPYSDKRVGAAIRLSTGEIFSGCNVENSSYGGTVCAERTAIFSAQIGSNDGKKNSPISVREVLVLTDAEEPWPPCGMCRQVVAEFASENCIVHLVNLEKKIISTTFQELFPHGFSPNHLKK